MKGHRKIITPEIHIPPPILAVILTSDSEGFSLHLPPQPCSRPSSSLLWVIIAPSDWFFCVYNKLPPPLPMQPSEYVTPVVIVPQWLQLTGTKQSLPPPAVLPSLTCSWWFCNKPSLRELALAVLFTWNVLPLRELQGLTLAFREYFKEAFPGHSANTATHPGSPYSRSCFTFPLALITNSLTNQLTL